MDRQDRVRVTVHAYALDRADMSPLTWLMVACLVSIMILIKKLADLDNERQRQAEIAARGQSEWPEGMMPEYRTGLLGTRFVRWVKVSEIVWMDEKDDWSE